MDNGTKVYSFNGKEIGIATGSTRRCQLEGCLGIRIMVRWPDGKATWPCTKGLTAYKKGYRIGCESEWRRAS